MMGDGGVSKASYRFPKRARASIIAVQGGLKQIQHI
jgi:hypothetical protein